ncbi:MULTISPECIES: hypothetical protein [unclassified Streptomyces]|uniref:hypothetical protein n=1 Tax=unclassified Streptomyces TaxID=2593676 RepID=UPI002DDA2B9E|nr:MULTISPECIES: hypothetical protein [unclassified Streptomyces]WSA91645.1 hypothetical protein OIE63_08780 [Streptomyces sp. NBC_01795]WSB76017.1 hypothetical protein OHB04_09585 [Streptomyces sp. NBC_01775]WSS15709.1 hypothetical protein OG533_30345 [Streptomyces sp. NBC_01186]WSS44549.1 hypothetical protein OG220_31140 [Streptomyces sp. NBC_01187]
MGWTSEEFGDSHEGWTGALLADGSEPKPVYLDAGSGSHMEKTSAWWAYSGILNRPVAAQARAACTCGWRGTRRIELDWDRIGETRPGDFDDSESYEDWSAHIAEVEARAIPLPAEVTDGLEVLAERLHALAEQSPTAALRAASALERLAADIGRTAAFEIRAEEVPAEAVGEALGLSVTSARSRVTRYRLRH